MQAAQALAVLLSQSVEDRSAIDTASNDVSTCGPNLSSDSETFSQAANSRQSLLSDISTIQDVSSLPSQLIQALTNAWQASEQVDEDYSNWAADENDGDCTPDDTSDPNYMNADGPNQQATAAKQEFCNLWDPIAAKFNLTSYQWNEL
jgi:hypothetical protein